MNIFDIFEILDELLDEPVINLSERRPTRQRYFLRQKPVKRKNIYKPPQYRKRYKPAQIDEDYSGLLDAFNMR